MPLSRTWLLAYALIAALWIWSLWVWPSLPERTPAHFGLDGAVNRWEDASVFGWFRIPIIALGTTIVIHVAAWLSIRNPRWVNLPQKDELLALAPERQRAVLAKIRDGLGLTAVLTALIMVMVQQLVWHVALGGDATWLSIATMVVGVLTGPIITVVLLVSTQRELNRQIALDRENAETAYGG